MHKIIRNETVCRFLRLEMEFYWNRIKHFTYLQLLCAYDDVIGYESYFELTSSSMDNQVLRPAFSEVLPTEFVTGSYAILTGSDEHGMKK